MPKPKTTRGPYRVRYRRLPTIPPEFIPDRYLYVYLRRYDTLPSQEAFPYLDPSHVLIHYYIKYQFRSVNDVADEITAAGFPIGREYVRLIHSAIDHVLDAPQVLS